jgi:predicted RNase H-like HicB family nuclease
MRKRQYLVRVNKDPNSDWGASVLYLPGCVATGGTIDITLRRIERAITLHLRGLREDAINPPLARHRSVTPRRTQRQVDFLRNCRSGCLTNRFRSLTAPDGRDR